uniref:MFS transporter n=1 Tax=Hylemonella sp. TaxID=2066020 RepID=UPI0035AE0F6C
MTSTTPHPAETAPALAGRREWIGLALIALPCAVYAMDLTVLNLALPAISADLQPTPSQLLWMIDIYGFLVAGFLITMGTLGDRIGRRRLLLIGAAAFAAASALAALARSAEALIALRALLGVAGATLAPSTLSLIRNMFHDERQRQFAIGIWITAFSVGSAIGPLAGGVLLQWFHWGSVFLAAVPVMLLLLLLGPSLLPEYRDPQAGHIDLPSVGLSLGTVLPLIWSLKQLAENGAGAAAFAALAIGLGMGLIFVRRQGRLAYPLLDLSLFRRAAFSAALSTYALSCLAMFGVYIFIAQYLQGVLGLSPLAAGLATVPWALSFVVGSLLAPRLAQRWPAHRLLAGALLMSAIGFALLLATNHERATLPVLIVATIVMSLGLAPVFTIGTEIVVTSAPPERAGAASAMAETASEFSGACGIAIFGSLGTWLYRERLLASLPAEVPVDSAVAAGASLGGALSAAATLPGALGHALRDAAGHAFTDALHAVAAAGGVLLLIAAVLVWRMLTPRRGESAA